MWGRRNGTHLVQLAETVLKESHKRLAVVTYIIIIKTIFYYYKIYLFIFSMVLGIIIY